MCGEGSVCAGPEAGGRARADPPRLLCLRLLFHVALAGSQDLKLSWEAHLGDKLTLEGKENGFVSHSDWGRHLGHSSAPPGFPHGRSRIPFFPAKGHT